MHKKTALIILILMPLQSFCQDRLIPLTFSWFNESTAIPFTRLLTTPIHPGIQLGTEFNLKVHKRTRLFQTANISYFYHRYLSQGIGLHTEFGYERRSTSGISFSALLGLGYTHTFATTEEFYFRNGQYVERADRGNARFTPSFSLDAGYYLHHNNPLSPKIFIRYQTWLEYPYSPGFIPVMSHINLHMGVKFFIQKGK